MAVREDPEMPVWSLTDRVSEDLRAFVAEHRDYLGRMHADLGLLADAAETAVLAGGKRLRPTFAYWGWRTAQPAGGEGEDALLQAAASLELLHACALVHDDVMDASDTRRGKPAAHVRFAEQHAELGWTGRPADFGRSGAILLGDLLLSWSEEMFAQASRSLPGADAARAQFDLMRTEVVAGQFLDLIAQTRGAFDPDEALRVIRFKTSEYTVVRPLLLGAGAAGASTALLDQLAGYGYALGEAFQLRDDLLGVFGDPAQTGKPAGDDLREGKRTLLVAWAMQAGDEQQQAAVRRGVGNPALTVAEVEQLRGLLTETGVRAAIEARIAQRAADAVACLTTSMRDDARQALAELAQAAAHRTS